jgi:cyclopropane-fatty-acyl-phospholipid synthase
VSLFVNDVIIPVFPGGFLPTFTVSIDTLRSGSKNRLIVDSVSNIGPHYARTLREWRKRFFDRFEDSIVPALQDEHRSVMGPTCGEQGRSEIEVFKRKWIYKIRQSCSPEII